MTKLKLILLTLFISYFFPNLTCATTSSKDPVAATSLSQYRHSKNDFLNSALDSPYVIRDDDKNDRKYRDKAHLGSFLFSFLFGKRKKADCSSCTKDSDCRSNNCWSEICIGDTTEISKKKCFPNMFFECESCGDHAECLSSFCHQGKCSTGEDSSIRRCLTLECGDCDEHKDCITNKCYRGKCVERSRAKLKESKEKCFPSVLKEDCERCEHEEDCKSGNCWGGKCTDFSKYSLNQCFAAECEQCRHHVECSTQHCYDGKCVYKNLTESMTKCFKPKFECETCETAEECESGVCWNGKCTDRTSRSLKKCFLPGCSICEHNSDCISQECDEGRKRCKEENRKEKCPALKTECEICTEDYECNKDKCTNGKCGDGSENSQKKCFLPECSECLTDGECSTKKCFDKKCAYENNSTSLNKCLGPAGNKTECSYCSKSTECETRRCLGSKCVYDSQESKDKCFIGDGIRTKEECQECFEDEACLTNKCWFGKCVFLNDSSISKCFKDKTEVQHKNQNKRN